MSVYPEEIASAVREPRFCGTVPEANAVAAEAKLDCGCHFRVEMRIDHDSQTIREIAYRTNGCGYMVATAEGLSARLLGKSLLDLHGEINADGTGRPECTSTVVIAVLAAFADHRRRQIEEFRGEKALICTCFGVTEETIEDYVLTSHPSSVSEVSQTLRAGSGCGSCRMLIQEIIDANS